MTRRILFITGTDTGVGKTVVTALLTASLRARGIDAIALKPISSGSRTDARHLRTAQSNALSLAEINPWHFRAPLAPLLAARREKRRLHLAAVVAHVRRLAREHELTLVEGAGGLLSPLGEDFDSRDLLLALRARPLIVAPNRLGVVNQVLLTLAALPTATRRLASVILIAPPHVNAAARTNPELLRELANCTPVLEFPWLSPWPYLPACLDCVDVARVLDQLAL